MVDLDTGLSAVLGMYGGASSQKKTEMLRGRQRGLCACQNGHSVLMCFLNKWLVFLPPVRWIQFCLILWEYFEINPVMFLKCLDTPVLNTKEKLRNKLIVLYSGRTAVLGCERSTIFYNAAKRKNWDAAYGECWLSCTLNYFITELW